jgi:nucleoside-diphosphate-sugar epimerase
MNFPPQRRDSILVTGGEGFIGQHVLQVNCGNAAVSGFPRVMEAERFKAEFNYSPVALKDRLRAAFQTQSS